MARVKGLVFVLSGPSGVGKDAVLQRLAERGVELGRVVTAVTRRPRPHEVEGVDYYFLTREEFDRMVAEGGFLEWADYVGSPRGTPRFGLTRTLAAGRDAVLKIDVDGFRQVRSQLPQAVSVFLAPPSLEVLERRLRARGDVTGDDLARRLDRARLELAAAAEYEYRVVNADGRLDETVDRVAEIVATERARRPPRLVEMDA